MEKTEKKKWEIFTSLLSLEARERLAFGNLNFNGGSRPNHQSYTQT